MQLKWHRFCMLLALFESYVFGNLIESSGFSCKTKFGMRLDRKLHGPPKTGPPPFELQILDEDGRQTEFYEVGKIYTVRLIGYTHYRGLILQARICDEHGFVIGAVRGGRFLETPSWIEYGLRLQECDLRYPQEDSVTHADDSRKFVSQVQWTTNRDVGNVQFILTIASENDIYWERWRPRGGFLQPMQKKLESSKILRQVFSNEKYALKFLAEKLTSQEGKVGSSEALKGESDVDSLISLNPETKQALETIEIPEFWNKHDEEVKIKNENNPKIVENVEKITESTPKSSSLNPVTEKTEISSTETTTTLSTEKSVENVKNKKELIPVHESITTAPSENLKEEALPEHLSKNSGESKIKENDEMNENLEELPENREKTASEEEEEKILDPKMIKEVAKKLDEMSKTTAIPVHESISEKFTIEKVTSKNQKNDKKEKENTNSGEALVEAKDVETQNTTEVLETKLVKDVNLTVENKQKLQTEVSKIDKNIEKTEVSTTPVSENKTESQNEEDSSPMNEEKIVTNETNVETTDSNVNSTTIPSDDSTSQLTVTVDNGTVTEIPESEEEAEETASEDMSPKYESEEKPEELESKKEWEEEAATLLQNKELAEKISETSNDMVKKQEGDEKNDLIKAEKVSDSGEIEGSGEELTKHPKAAIRRLK